MEFRFTHTVIAIVLSVCLVHLAFGIPRTADRRDEVLPLNQQAVNPEHFEKTTNTPISDVKVPSGRVPCNFEEVTEDSICQEHCLPKGYSYGVCVSYTCSCI